MSARFLSPRLDLGLRARARALRGAFARPTVGGDLRAGVSALGLTVPVAALVAVHAGVPVTAALITVVVGSAVTALVGGAGGGIAMPGIATAIAVAGITRDVGPSGLALACAGCGVLQLAAGALGLGRVARFAPIGVVAAFALGTGGLAALLALPHALGLKPSPELGAVRLLDHVIASGRETSTAALAIAAVLATVGVVLLRRRTGAAVLAALVAVAAALAAVLRLDVPRLPDVAMALPVDAAVALSGPRPGHFVVVVLTLFAFASVETLLATSAEEEGAGRPAGEDGPRQDHDQELIAHGLANLALAFVGGLPVAATVLRAPVVARAGVRTPVAGLAHAVAAIPVAVAVLAFDRFVPLAALGAVVLAHAVPLLDPRRWRSLWRVSRAHGAVLAVTVVVMLGRGVLDAIELGLVLSLLVSVARVARTRGSLQRGGDGAPHQITLDGPLTFLGAPALERLRDELAATDVAAGVIVDVRAVRAMDATGARRLVRLAADVGARGGRVVVLGAAPACQAALEASDTAGVLAGRLAVTDRDVDALLGRERAFELRAHVVASMARFRDEVREHYVPLLEKFSEGQQPHTLFIGCVDSRVTPALITGTHPGELFVVRCLGAMVLPVDAGFVATEAGAIEYAVGVLGVRNVVVCGHSGCGAVRAVKTRQVPPELTALTHWLVPAQLAAGDLAPFTDLDDAARAVTVRQVENLRRFPAIAQRLDAGTLTLYAWFYDVGKAELFEWREAERRFETMKPA